MIQPGRLRTHRKVHIYVLEIEKYCKEKSAGKFVSLYESHGQLGS